MPKTTFAEHPLHPGLITLPAALLPTSLTLDLACRVANVHALLQRGSQPEAAR